MHSVLEQTKVEAETSRYVARNKLLVVIKEVKGGRGRGLGLRRMILIHTNFLDLWNKKAKN